MSYTFFFREQSPFSNWHPCTFEYRGVLYNCAEQAIMAMKATLFGDHKTLQEIMLAKTPKEQKALGRKVREFDPDEWYAAAESLVYSICKAKFSQNPDLKRSLMDTSGTVMVEASPYDEIWGIGLSENDAKKVQPSEWPGRNLLGNILTRVREDLRNG